MCLIGVLSDRFLLRHLEGLETFARGAHPHFCRPVQRARHGSIAIRFERDASHSIAVPRHNLGVSKALSDVRVITNSIAMLHRET